MVYELLWREFFHRRALTDDISLFRAGGEPGKVRRCTFEPRNFARWCQGDTNYALVNALMHQLLETGWMSNRGRQIAASCLVNEYGIEWRYGAAFFEKHLIDFDVASNYGNWQYLARVGADPRGGRHFNLQKQTEHCDPSSLSIRCLPRPDGAFKRYAKAMCSTTTPAASPSRRFARTMALPPVAWAGNTYTNPAWCRTGHLVFPDPG